ncbi:MAG TPA: aryl-sulfate sulfotransferase [Flavobacteriaceae bacterium]|nr:aryl-sulfate sulfotransferase [Flavobacteriaceae bacterium]
MRSKKIFLAALSFWCLLACSNDSTISEQPIEENLSENVEVYEPELINESLVFSMQQDGANLINKEGDTIKSWDFGYSLGNDAKILPNTNIIGMFRADSPSFSFGGYGGIVRMFDFEGNELWNFNYASENYLAHHDVLYLDNGNVMFQAWQRLTAEEANQLGIDTTTDLFPESILEVNPNTNEIVWEWHSKDHLVQEIHSEAVATYGTVSENPQLIHVNYNLGHGGDNLIENGNIMHCNGIFYDSEKDVIYLSILQYSEVWVIDHGTTTEEAASHSGGNYNKGGDLLYRFGNPSAYNNLTGERLFHRTHTPRIIEENYPGAGNFLIYMNGTNEAEGSVIYEFQLPEVFDLQPNQNNEPQVVWSFEDDNLFYDRISGAQRLPNGNTLICEGDYGFWEVTPNQEIAWKYNGIGNFWRAYSYELDDPSLSLLEIE